MTEVKLKELKDSGKSVTQLVVDGELSNLKDLYQYAIERDRSLTESESQFLEKWADQAENMSMIEIEYTRIDTGVNELILVGMLELGVQKITIGDLLRPMKREPKYEEVKRDFLNYMKHFLPPGK